MNGRSDSFDESLIELCFGSSANELAGSSNCIAKAGPIFLSRILEVVGEVAGMWGGNAPFFSESGRPICDLMWEMPEYFSLWGAPEKQEWLLEQGSYSVLGQFSMIIPVATDVVQLRRMYETCPTEGSPNYDYAWCMPELPRWLPGLSWAYVPLTDETDWALFVTNADRRSVVKEIREAFSANGSLCLQLRRKSGRAIVS